MNENEFYKVDPFAPELNPAEMLSASEINLSEALQKPPICLYMGDESLFYLGDISTTIGKAKGRKTFASGFILAALAGNCTIQNKFRAVLPDNKRMVLYFDTEQGVYHAQKAAKRVLRLLNVDYLPNFKAYGLRKHTPADRLQIIDFAINNTPDLGFVYIDGIRDLITSINDEEQATMITTKLLRWSGELNIHINCVLHMNKSDQNARGHVGTELMNKSLTVLGVNKKEKQDDYSTIEAIACRDKEPEPITFGIDADGLPYILDLDQIQILKAMAEVKSKKNLQPSDYSTDTHIEILETKIFNKQDEREYSELLSSVQNAYSAGTNKAKNMITYLVDFEFLAKEKRGNKTFYSMVKNE